MIQYRGILHFSGDVLVLVVPFLSLNYFVCIGVMYSGEYDVCDVTLSGNPHRVSLAAVGIEPATIGILVKCSAK